VLSQPWLNMTKQLSSPQCNQTSDVISGRLVGHPDTLTNIDSRSSPAEASNQLDPTSSVYRPPPPNSPRPYKTNVSDPYVVQAVVYINEFYQQHGDHTPRVAVKVINATVQVVNGFIYRFDIEVKSGSRGHEDCEVTVLSQPWLNMTKQLSSPQCNQTSDVISGRLVGHPDTLTNIDSRSSPAEASNQLDPTSSVYRPPPPNSPRPYKTNVSDPYVVQAVVYINEFYQQHGDHTPRVAVKVINATVQTVSGWLYRFEIEVKSGSRLETCDVTVWSKPWLNMTSQLSSPQCNETSDVISRRQLEDPVNVTMFDPQVQKAFELIEERINTQIRANSSRVLRAAAARQITRQKVNGAIFQFDDVKFWLTSCLKDVDVYSATCTYDVTSAPEVVCTGAVWWSPRQYPTYQLLGVECKP